MPCIFGRFGFFPGQVPRGAAYVLAVLAPGLTLALRMGMAETFHNRPLLILFMLPIILCSLLGGLGPGLLATMLSAAGLLFFVIPPELSLQIALTSDLVQLCFLVLSGVLVSALSGWLRRSTERLRQSENRYHALFDAMTEGLCVLELVRGEDGVPVDCLVREVNPAYEHSLVRKREDVIGRRLTELLGVERPPDIDRYARIVASGAPERFEAHVPSLGRWFHISAFPVQGDVLAVVYKDLTGRRRAEEGQRVSEHRFRELFNRSPVALCFVDVKDRVLDVNQQFVRTFGYVREDIPTMQDWRMLAYPEPEYRRWVQEDWAAARRLAEDTGANIAPRQYRITCKDGQEREIVLSGIAVSGGFMATFSDVTERMRAEEALRQSEFKFRTVADFTQDWEYWRGPDGTMVWVSPSCERITGYAAREFTEDRALVRSIIHPDDRTLFNGHIDKSETFNAEPCTMDLRLVRRDGGEVWVSHKCRAIVNERGEYLGRRASNTDITERKRMELALREAKNAAEASSRAKSEFLANMSHEIRTPLNGMLGMLQLLQGGDVERSDTELYTGLALDAGRRLLGLLNDILDVSGMESGRVTLRREPFAVADILDSVTNMFRIACASKHLRLELELDPGVPRRLLGDEARIRQILFNLVGNAVKFTPAGEVRLTAWTGVQAARPGVVRLYFCVSDTGIGIPQSKLDYVFERFTQSDGSFTRQYEGAGLGLAIVKRLVELMGGALEVDSQVGEGTSIWVQLPLGLPVAEAPVAARAQAPAQETRKRILVVEDESVSRLAMKGMLERMGHAVTTAGDGQDAVQAMEGAEFDCVLMDIQMPVLDGVEATRRIHAAQEALGRVRTPVIAVTAYAMPGDRERFLGAGMDGYVSKPVQEEELGRALRNCL